MGVQHISESAEGIVTLRQRPPAVRSLAALERGAQLNRSGETVTVIVPLFNEQETLEALRARLVAVLEGLACKWVILFVDDGSTDNSLSILKDFNRQDPRICALSLSRNFGKERAVAAGLQYAKGDAAILIDADLQHPPEILREFVERWRQGYDFVYGERLDRDGRRTLRRGLASGFYALFRALSGIPLPAGSGDFRLLSRKAIDAMNQMGERTRFNKGLYSWIGFKTVGVPYVPAPRDYGNPKWSRRRLVEFAIDGLTAFSTVPLRVWSLIGCVMSLTALAYAMYFLFSTLIFGADLPGFPSLIVSIMLLSGMQLISLGILGEYLGRVYEEVKGRPLYLVAEEVGIENHASQRS
jgi:glycosyltransferase involved in cell wall biosynthesis